MNVEQWSLISQLKMPDVNAFSVLIQVLSRDVGKIISFSGGENLVAIDTHKKKRFY